GVGSCRQTWGKVMSELDTASTNPPWTSGLPPMVVECKTCYFDCGLPAPRTSRTILRPYDGLYLGAYADTLSAPGQRHRRIGAGRQLRNDIPPARPPRSQTGSARR